ncbi:unnamed protein product [Durusdinium trenchii]|uniref:PROP1-like PPR domain-containing protein n=1 Tax=Durusdinium trenchii TaxID=1381693 RepID=A0ABP0QWN0_9DINO
MSRPGRGRSGRLTSSRPLWRSAAAVLLWLHRPELSCVLPNAGEVDGRRMEVKLQLCKRMDQAIRARDELSATICLDEALRLWIDLEAATFSPLIDLAAQEGDLQRAEQWFENAQLFSVKLDDVEFNSLVTAAANQGNLSAAEAWYDKAVAAGIQPDAVTLTALMRAAAAVKDRSRAKEWYRAAPSLRVAPNEVMHSCLLHALRENATEVEECFAAGRLQPNAVMYNTIIDAMARAGEMKSAEEYFQRLCGEFRPDAATFGALINGAAEQGDVDGAKEWMKKMENFGIRRNMVSWNALFKAFRHRPGSEAEELFEEMVQQRHAPDAVTLISLIGFLGKPRVRGLCSELKVDYDRIIREPVVNRAVKRADPHFQLSEQYRRMSRFSLRAQRALGATGTDQAETCR